MTRRLVGRDRPSRRRSESSREKEPGQKEPGQKEPGQTEAGQKEVGPTRVAPREAGLTESGWGLRGATTRPSGSLRPPLPARNRRTPAPRRIDSAVRGRKRAETTLPSAAAARTRWRSGSARERCRSEGGGRRTTRSRTRGC